MSTHKLSEVLPKYKFVDGVAERVLAVLDAVQEAEDYAFDEEHLQIIVNAMESLWAEFPGAATTDPEKIK